MNDKYVIHIDSEDVEIDKDSALGKAKEFIDWYDQELLTMMQETHDALFPKAKTRTEMIAEDNFEIAEKGEEW